MEGEKKKEKNQHKINTFTFATLKAKPTQNQYEKINLKKQHDMK